jgi:hypothetical protein
MKKRSMTFYVCAFLLCIIWTLGGVVACTSTLHRTEASVTVHTRWGEYNRRPPGGKIADDLADEKTLWMRCLIFLAWGTPFVAAACLPRGEPK